MACAVDSSTPIRFSGTGGKNTNIDSANFTAPANSLLVLCVEHDGQASGGLDTGDITLTISLTTGAALTWTPQVSRQISETTSGGASFIFTAPAVTSEARVVRVNSNWSGAGAGPVRRSAKLRVITGADLGGTPVDTVGANNEGGSLTNNINTTSITPGANGLLIGADCDWSAGGGSNAFEAPSDGSTQDTANYSGEISVCDGYRTCTSGVGVTMNFNAGGAAAAQHKWCQIIVRESVSVSLPYVLVAN